MPAYPYPLPDKDGGGWPLTGMSCAQCNCPAWVSKRELELGEHPALCADCCLSEERADREKYHSKWAAWSRRFFKKALD